MENRRIMLESVSNGIVCLIDRDSRLNRTFERKGSKKPVELDMLKQAIYNPGVEALFTQGYLRIAEDDELDILIELGLEEPGATEPENVIVLNDAQRKRLMTTAPISEFKETIKKLPREQVNMMCEFAILNKLTDYERCQFLKSVCGTDILKSIELQRSAEEEI